MKHKLLLLAALSILALSFLANAQTTTNVPGVTLSGPLTDPILVNHSGKMVVAALVSVMDATGAPYPDLHIFANDRVTGVPDGGASKAGGRRKYDSPIVSAKIHAVIFGDGEFRGKDSYESGDGESAQAYFRPRAEHSMQGMRQIWQTAKSGDWAAVKALASKSLPDSNDDIYVWVLAQYMVTLQAKEGSDKAVASTVFFGNLPASTWTSGQLLNKLKFPNSLEAIANWIMPTSHAYGR